MPQKRARDTPPLPQPPPPLVTATVAPWQTATPIGKNAGRCCCARGRGRGRACARHSSLRHRRRRVQKQAPFLLVAAVATVELFFGGIEPLVALVSTIFSGGSI